MHWYSRSTARAAFMALGVLALGCAGQTGRYQSDMNRPPTLNERQVGPVYQPVPPVPPVPATGNLAPGPGIR
ncbi:hypothetical protein [Candidatus Nitrospira bockiana]